MKSAKVYTVRKRTVSGIGRRYRKARGSRGAVLVPGQMIGSRVVVLSAGEYKEFKRYERKLGAIYGMLRNGIDS